MSTSEENGAERPDVHCQGASGRMVVSLPQRCGAAGVLPTDQWTLIGGLMTQMHAINRGVDAVRAN